MICGRRISGELTIVFRMLRSPLIGFISPAWLWTRFDPGKQKPDKSSKKSAFCGWKTLPTSPWNNDRSWKSYLFTIWWQPKPIIFALPSRKFLSGQPGKLLKPFWNGGPSELPIVVLSQLLQLLKRSETIDVLEGFNSLIQTVKAWSRGYSTSLNLITMAYLGAGKLDFGFPT